MFFDRLEGAGNVPRTLLRLFWCAMLVEGIIIAFPQPRIYHEDISVAWPWSIANELDSPSIQVQAITSALYLMRIAPVIISILLFIAAATFIRKKVDSIPLKEILRRNVVLSAIYFNLAHGIASIQINWLPTNWFWILDLQNMQYYYGPSYMYTHVIPFFIIFHVYMVYAFLTIAIAVLHWKLQSRLP